MFFALLLITLSCAHNWIHGTSRVGKASQLQPAPPRLAKRRPHRQIGKDQIFGIEWVNGHPGSYYYFVVLKATDEDKLELHTEKLLNDYIAKAQPKDYIYSDPKFQKMHVSCTHKYKSNPAGRSDCSSTAWNSGAGYDRILTKNDPIFMDRSPWHPNPQSDMTHFKYKDSHIKYDKRVSYNSTDYPWIEAVHKFRVQIKFPKEWDVARFSLPARQGSGEYMIHMLWRGYRDVIDIDVLPAPAKDIYGKAGGSKRWIKTEHCQYPNYKNHRKSRCFFGQPGDSVMIKKCLDDCVKRGTRNCQAINVVPLYTPDAVKIQGDSVLDAQVPWQAKGMSKFCKHTSVPANLKNKKDSLVCYGFVPGTPTDPAFNPETEDKWYVRDTDPEDPVFYSTCYRLEVKREFVGNVACPLCEAGGKANEPRWQVGEYCLNCADLKAKKALEEVQFWKTAEVCEKCF